MAARLPIRGMNYVIPFRRCRSWKFNMGAAKLDEFKS